MTDKRLEILLATAAVCVSPLARADCAMGNEYSTLTAGSSVLVCLSISSPRYALVREGSDGGDGGELLEVPGSCIDVAGGVWLPDGGVSSEYAPFEADGGFPVSTGCCFLDRCVPAGIYRYGLTTPIACPNGCSGSAAYWIDVTVTAGLDAGCTGGAITGHPSGAPWPASGPQELTCGSSGPVVSLSPVSNAGCSSAGTVFGFDGAVLALSLVLWASRRRRG